MSNDIKCCEVCGEILSSEDMVCKSCGHQNGEKEEQSNATHSKVRKGWSDKIYDPKFEKFRNNRHRYSLIFGTVLAIIAFVGFNIYGAKTQNQDEMFMVGSVIGGMFLLISIGSVLSSKRAKLGKEQ